MTRFALLLALAAGNVLAADAAVDIDTAAKIYQDAAVRDQVRASLVAMPKQIRDMFSRDVSTRLTDEQLAAVDAAAAHGFRIDVFEAPALSALAQNLDAAGIAKIEAFLQSDLGKRMVADDVASATMGEANIDKVMSGETAVPLTAKRAALFDKLEHATRSTESTVDIFLGHGPGRRYRHRHRLGTRSEQRRRAGAKIRRSEPRRTRARHARADAAFSRLLVS